MIFSLSNNLGNIKRVKFGASLMPHSNNKNEIPQLRLIAHIPLFLLGKINHNLTHSDTFFLPRFLLKLSAAKGQDVFAPHPTSCPILSPCKASSDASGNLAGRVQEGRIGCKSFSGHFLRLHIPPPFFGG